MVSQDVILFDDTIKNNILCRPGATQKDIETHAGMLRDEFIEKLPNKFDTIVGENGVKLSGGQKQRISIEQF